ncbi:M48 family metalloprotease [Rhodococcus koreensis]|uniref:M48 family metalloprotease n=1 Tax=Rhodococcus koreensis TaxID=99653 RepID=UPI00308450B9
MALDDHQLRAVLAHERAHLNGGHRLLLGPVRARAAAMHPILRDGGLVDDADVAETPGKLVRPAAIYTGPAPRTPRVRRGLGQIAHTS